MAEYTTNNIQSPLELHGFQKFLSMISHRWLERAIWIFCDLGVADLMEMHKTPITASKLSRLNGNDWNAEHLYRLLRVVASAGIIKQSDENYEDINESDHPEKTVKFELTDDGFYLTSNHVSRARDMIRFELGPHADKAVSFGPSLIKDGCRNGNGFEQAFGCSFFDYINAENKEYASIFNNAMAALSNSEPLDIISIIDFSAFNKLVDVGGGLCTLLSSILEKFRNLHGVLFDLPPVIENIKAMTPNEFEKRLIEPSRYDFVAGDVFISGTVPMADAYILKYLIHGWNDEKAIEILKSIHNANKSHIGKTITVFIAECIIMANSKENLEVYAMDLEMLVFLNSKERTLTQYNYLLSEGGYKLKQIHRTLGYLSIIEAVTTIEHSN